MRVMIVDDEELNRELFSDMLEDEDGVETVCVEDGKKAVDMLDQFEPDVILLDIMMPVMDGLQACKKMREKRPGRPPKIIMITGMAGDDVEKKGVAVGADKLFFKPININVLLSEVLDE